MNNVKVEKYFLEFQQQLVNKLNQFENDKRFIVDQWEHAQGGGGKSCVLENGDVFAKAGVNFSNVKGQSLPASATASRPQLKGCQFQAMGVSVVIHPVNPFIPTTHMNVRFFNATTLEDKKIWWFGGGFDLTPYYVFIEDVLHWHKMAKAACEPYSKAYYQRFKKACDEYFYLPHRGETRGVGGLFFDDFNELDFQQSFSFVQSVAQHFILAYLPVVHKRLSQPFTIQHVDFQSYRRGRYVEFNLVYDRGTLFGLQSGGRVESILMSMPPTANWRYNWTPTIDSAEAELAQYLKPREWLDE